MATLTVREYGASTGTPTPADAIGGNKAPQYREAPFSTGGNGQKVVGTAGTPVKLNGTSVPCRLIYLRAHDDNAGVIVWGFSNGIDAVDATTGRPTADAIEPGGVRVIPVSDLALVYIDAASSGDGVSFTYLTHTDT